MKWYVLYTRPNHERAVYARLHQGFEVYLPMVEQWSECHKQARKKSTLLFPRYLFVRCYLDTRTYLKLITVPGVIRLVEQGEGEFLVLSDEEVHTLQRLHNTGVAIERSEYPITGQWVQVTQGLLQGITGVLREGSRTTLVVPIHSLRESVAVEVSRAQVIPCSTGQDMQ